jgi:anti-anti-sigma regulatory factor
MIRAYSIGDRQRRLVRVRDRSRRLAARRLDPCRSRDTARRPEIRQPPRPAGVEIRGAAWRHTVRIELSGDVSRAAADRLSSCLERALETRAERVILDLRGLDRLDPAAVSPILIAHLTADSEHRQLLLIPGSARVQRVLDHAKGPFSYLRPDDDSWQRYEVGRPEVLTTGRQHTRARRRFLDRLLGSTDRLIAATEHAPEPIRTFEYVGASTLLSALELWLLIKDRAARS